MSHVMTSTRGRIGQRRRRLPPGSTAEQTSTVSASDARLVSWLISAGLVITTSTLFCAFVPALWHWLIVPTSVAGVLLGVDAVDWVRGRLETFQPRAVVALFGLHLCYLGPLLHVALDYWPRYVSPAQDWRQSLALLGVVNASGLLIYRFVLSLRPAPRGPRVAHRLDEHRLITASSAVVAVGFGALVVLLLAFGGPAQYLRVVAGHRELLAGRGWLLLLAESWPMVLFMTVLVTGRRWLRASTPLTLAALAAFVVAQLVVGGLRGSRAETVWPAITAAV
ncbi:hypothetical protein, partial [Microlunatus ginsengisoli]|uniref:hypothetical protein n=1 Tax=Microlunatus ginsengisoli TaxID=363863 RepID=UPI0031DACA28